MSFHSPCDLSKSTHHPTNKKPHECGANIFYKYDELLN
jgi:hypothetical protein